jgi:hypothetical protein
MYSLIYIMGMAGQPNRKRRGLWWEKLWELAPFAFKD